MPPYVYLANNSITLHHRRLPTLLYTNITLLRICIYIHPNLLRTTITSITVILDLPHQLPQNVKQNAFTCTFYKQM
jgi:hypothetical protein